MTDKERLIELIGEKIATSEYENYNSFEYAENLADYLLANGVIIPPCKVGDTIYKLILYKNGQGYIVEQNVVGFHLGKFPHLRGQERKQYIIVYHEILNNISHININQLGKTVFLTKEEAEAKLKELGK